MKLPPGPGFDGRVKEFRQRGGSRPARLSLLKRHLANKLEAVRKSLLSEGAETVPDDRI